MSAITVGATTATCSISAAVHVSFVDTFTVNCTGFRDNMTRLALTYMFNVDFGDHQCSGYGQLTTKKTINIKRNTYD